MSTTSYGATGRFLFLFVLLTSLVAGEAIGEVGVNVNINLGPPPVTVVAPPAVVMVPQSQVYFVPGVSFDVFYHNGYWWSPRGGTWYRSRAYNGPWGVVDHRYVPPQVIQVPHDYRSVYEKEKHIPYGQWKKEHSSKEKKHKDNKGNDEKHGKGHDKGHGEGHGKDQ
jgi:hypothetical protein